MLDPSRSTLPVDNAVERPSGKAVVFAVNAQSRALSELLGQSNVAVNSRASSAPPASSRSTGTSGFSAGRGHHDLDDAAPQVQESYRRAASAGSMWSSLRFWGFCVVVKLLSFDHFGHRDETETIPSRETEPPCHAASIDPAVLHQQRRSRSQITLDSQFSNRRIASAFDS
jgi:hypothetical protein